MIKVSKSFFYNEKNLINLIRFGAMGVVLIFSFIITYIFIHDRYEDLKIESKLIEENYIQNNKKRVQNLVNKIDQIIDLEKKFAQDELNEKIKEQIYQAHAIATSIYTSHLNKKIHDKEEIIKEIKTALKGMRFNNDLGYMFIYEMNGKNILNAEFPTIEGKNLWNYKDAKGTLLLQDMNKILFKKDETFYDWYWRKSKDDPKQYKKTGFFKKFEPYDLFIGTGDYVEEFEKRVMKKVLEKINALKFEKPEHLFIYTLDGTCLVNPKKELIGKNRIDVKNKEGRYILKENLENVAKNKELFVRYEGSVVLNKSLKSNDKISFLKLYEPWQWMIGSGFHLEELYLQIDKREKILKEKNSKAVRDIVYYSIVITFVILLISFYLSEILFNIFRSYESELKVEMGKTLEKEKLLVQQSKMATMGEMIGNIAHQWKQPLGLISMSNGLIKLRETEQIPVEKEAIEDAIKNIDNSVNYLSHTIDDFRDFFKPDKEKKYFYFNDVYEKTYKLIDTQFNNNNIQIVKDIENLELYGYENEFLQVLINIIKNAKDELIKIDTKQKKILFIKTYCTDGLSIIKIKDNAGGIKDNIIDKIFEPYFTTKEDSEGTGIGLYMSKQLVEGMNGKIEVKNSKYTYEDVEYSGAQFSIELPQKGKEDG